MNINKPNYVQKKHPSENIKVSSSDSQNVNNTNSNGVQNNKSTNINTVFPSGNTPSNIQENILLDKSKKWNQFTTKKFTKK